MSPNYVKSFQNISNQLSFLWVISLYDDSFHMRCIFGGNGRPYNVARVKSKRIETSICSIINIKLSKPIFGLLCLNYWNWYIENITRRCEDMNFILEWYEKIKFMSSNRRVMFCLCREEVKIQVSNINFRSIMVNTWLYFN